MKKLLLSLVMLGSFGLINADCCPTNCCPTDCFSTSTTQAANCCGSNCCCDDNYPRSIFVPRQLAYNPILENALELNARVHDDWKYQFSIKPLYQQSVGDKFDRYFNICHKECLAVREDGSGDIDSLWFDVISSFSTFYSSNLSFEPKLQKFGAGLYGAFKLPKKFQISINTALVGVRTDMNICETQSEFLGTVPGFPTITASFASSARCYGKICGSHTKVGLDDIQVKLLRNVYEGDKATGSLYALLGIPTNTGSKAEYLFEPLVGSKHVQLGLGGYLTGDAYEYDRGVLSFLAEAKYRYAFGAYERRSFDLCPNGQWSRYMIFVTEAAPNNTFFAINSLSLKAKVTPASSFDLYLAAHWNVEKVHFELGYDFWYRSAEKIDLDCECPFPAVGIAGLVSIAKLAPKTSSTATMAQAVQPGINQMPTDAAFTPVTINNINQDSGAAPRSISNSVYGSLAYAFDHEKYDMRLGLNAAYERGHGVNVPDSVLVWIDFGIGF